ncbi:MAG: hypothetical protein EU540_02665 [Promethearchaeota archaeon]|nr:MAG: hypothetical protein EU540_02665 [Candidatus Lokiarchaeota archaeon]
MENEVLLEEKKNREKTFAIKGLIFIFLGITARVFILFFYYYIHMLNPYISWGDVYRNYHYESTEHYPLVSQIFIEIFVFLSFGRFGVFVFWAFFWELVTSLMFYFVIKSFNIKNKGYTFGFFLINPLLFFINIFSLEGCGYHITESFFLFFLFLALIYYPRKERYARYLFYIFLGLSMCIKYYTIPAIGFLFIKFLYEKNWKELKIMAILIVPLLIVLIFLPLFYLPYHYIALVIWNYRGSYVPRFIRALPFLCIFILFILFRLEKSDIFEILVISMVAFGTYLFFSWPFLRWFQSIIFYGILKEREFFRFKLNLGFIKREKIVNNHLLTFCLSFIGVFYSILIIIFYL